MTKAVDVIGDSDEGEAKGDVRKAKRLAMVMKAR